MAQGKYEVVWMPLVMDWLNDHVGDLEDRLNERARRGWELADCVVVGEEVIVLIYRKERQEGEP